MQFLEMANLSRQKADQWLPQRWKQRSSKSGGYSIGGKQVNTTRLGDGGTTLQTDFTNMTFILTMAGYYDMQTIPQETVLKGGARSQAALVDPSVAHSQHAPGTFLILCLCSGRSWKASLTKNLLWKLCSTHTSLQRSWFLLWTIQTLVLEPFIFITFSPHLVPVINFLSKELCIIHLSVLYYSLYRAGTLSDCL